MFQVRRIYWQPSRHWLCLLFLLMHSQHTLMPLVPWVEDALFASRMPPPLALSTEATAVVVYGFGWLTWSVGFCWHVRKAPPYPILRLVWDNGSWPFFYGAMVALGGAAMVAGRAWRFHLAYLQ